VASKAERDDEIRRVPGEPAGEGTNEDPAENQELKMLIRSCLEAGPDEPPWLQDLGLIGGR